MTETNDTLAFTLCTADHIAQIRAAEAICDMTQEAHAPAYLSLEGATIVDSVRALHRAGHKVIGLAGRSKVREREIAFNAGIDEILTCDPIIPAELWARRQFLLTGNSLPAELEFTDDRVLHVGDRTISLSQRQARLVRSLIDAGGGMVAHDALLTHCWGPHAAGRRHYLRVAINTLRQAIEPDPEFPRYLLSEAAIGYRMGPGNRLPDTSYMP